jgi:predicted transcriptional regulator
MASLTEIAAQLVAAHAATTPMTTQEIIAEISKVHAALKKLEAGETGGEIGESQPALALKDAFKKNEVVCLICGQGGFKTLARHLSTIHGMKPGAYKKQFGIPSKQVLSAKAYSESRRKMAKERGLADNLAKAREIRMAKLDTTKRIPSKTTIAAAKSPESLTKTTKAPKTTTTKA